MSLQYRAFGLRGVKHTKTEYKEDRVIFSVEMPKENLHCATCQSPRAILRGKKQRRFRCVPIGKRRIEAEALKPFWRRLRSARARIEAVAMDMSPAYIEAVSTRLPEAAIVIDPFQTPPKPP